MLDHDELLPEEQANPGLVQQLEITYSMKPEEKQVLTRVHERLAHGHYSSLVLEPISADVPAQAQQPVLLDSYLSRSIKSRQRWLRYLNSLAAVIMIGLLVGALALTFSIAGHTRIGSSTSTVVATSTIRIVLVPAQNGTEPSQAKMEAVRDILMQRFNDFGLHGASASLTTANDQPAIVVKLPHLDGNEQQTIHTLLETGMLAFWDTGPGSAVALGTFNPAPYARYNPGDEPRFANRDIDPGTLAISYDQANRPQINCMMQGDAVNRFRLYTASHIGHSLTITLDNNVLESAIIMTSISGPFVITGNFTQQQANAIVSVLKHDLLPVELKQQN